MTGLKQKRLKELNIGISRNGNNLSIQKRLKFLFAKNVARFIRCRIKWHITASG